MTCRKPLYDRHRLRDPTLATRAAGIARRAWRAYWDWRARRATVEILRSLDEPDAARHRH